MNSFEEIYRKYADDLYRFAFWLCGNANEAEDIVSESFLRLWGSLDDVRVETLKAYLLTIARNVFLARRRRETKYTTLDHELPDTGASPSTQQEQRDEAEKMMRSIASLPEGERSALLMRMQQELPYSEIARSLGISVAAAKVRVHRARLKLRDEIIENSPIPKSSFESDGAS